MEIPPFRLVATPMTEEAAALPQFRWAGPEVGKRHQLGGEPSFEQATDYPRCPSCPEEMTFYGQLDSLNDDINLADAGLVYVFVCFDCFTSTSFIQSG